MPDGSGGVRCSLDGAPLDDAPRGVAVLRVLGARWGRVRVVYSIVWSPATPERLCNKGGVRWSGDGTHDGTGPVHVDVQDRWTRSSEKRRSEFKTQNRRHTFLYDPKKNYSIQMGSNKRLDELHAAILEIKLAYLDKFNNKAI